MQHSFDYDVIIVGSGAAGLSLALRLNPQLRVAILSKGPLGDGSTAWAQGGISAVLDQSDSLDLHVQDTLTSGAGLCKQDTVEKVVELGPQAVRWLINLGVPFTKEPSNDDEYHLTREGGHSHRRVIHADDATGAAVSKTLLQHVQEHPNVTLLEYKIAVNLITEKDPAGAQRCTGLYVYDIHSKQVDTFNARSVVLATGGASKVYLYSSNPDSSTGDGIAMAWRAGCQVSNMEFMQFHPTCLYHPEARSFLLTEAIRGESGTLKHPKTKQRFMVGQHEMAELAPRDVVARAIDYEMKKSGVDHVYLDISHKPAAFIKQHFPTIHERCLGLGLDMTKEALPVVPAAHYTCGGVVVDEHGCTSIPGLLAIGETACTGLHGANRMASNSLLECLAYAWLAADWLNDTISTQGTLPQAASWDASRVSVAKEEVTIRHNWLALRRLMWDYVGIVRTDNRLKRALKRILSIREEIEEDYAKFTVTPDFIELRNLAQVAEIIVRSALARRESRGLHYNLDCPETATEPADTLLDKASTPTI